MKTRSEGQMGRGGSYHTSLVRYDLVRGRLDVVFKAENYETAVRKVGMLKSQRLKKTLLYIRQSLSCQLW